jgi:hypothetical protein
MRFLTAGLVALGLMAGARSAMAAPSYQCTTALPALGNAISVAANTATSIWSYNQYAQSLAITFATPPCALATADGNLSWYLGAGGWDFNSFGDRVPGSGLTITCTTAQTIYIAECH